jgi:hypothetical protein
MFDAIQQFWLKMLGLGQKLVSTSNMVRVFLFGLGVLFLAYLFEFITFPFRPFTTQGTIYVDSPEVYTRERLVNDRYDQDYWLRMRLKELDKPGNLQLVSAETVTSSSAQLDGSPLPSSTVIQEARGPEPQDRDAIDAPKDAQSDNEPSDSQVPNKDAGLFRFPFYQEFRIASGIRDTIRQQVLENMLDDRHDLTGNSVYGLKFDTTVIPGSNTLQRAVVRVSLTVDDLFNKGLSNPFATWVNLHIPDDGTENVKKKRLGNFTKLGDYYDRWLADLEKRLNSAETTVYEGLAKRSRYSCPAESEVKEGKKYMHHLTRDTLNMVLGVPTEVFERLNPLKGIYSEDSGESASAEYCAESAAKTDDLNSGCAIPTHQAIKLSAPWSRYFGLDRSPFTHSDHSASESAPCHYRVSFSVNPLIERFTIPLPTERVSEPKNKQNFMPAEDDLIPVGHLEGLKTALYVESLDYTIREPRFEKPDWPAYPPPIEPIRALLTSRDSLSSCDKAGPDEPCTSSDAQLTRLKIPAPSGFFNFIDRMSERDAYAYAIFPKNDLSGILEAQGSNLVGSFLSFAKHSRRSTTASSLIGFGEGSSADVSTDGVLSSRRGPVVFGWVISAQGPMEPTPRSQLALVSVPAWVSKLNLKIERGWIDRRGNPRFDGKPYQEKIAIPPDLDVFDFVFRENARFSLGPVIRLSEMDQDIYLRAGRRGKVLIPGSRLWRSATVTLGAQIAERIRVMPNMEGIIAEFDCVELPSSAYQPDEDAADVDGSGKITQPCGTPLPPAWQDSLSVRPVSLRVWTSEGVTRSGPNICVLFDPKEAKEPARHLCN